MANDSLTHTFISRAECTDLAAARPLLLETGYELNLDRKKEGDKNKQKKIMADFFCSETGDSKNICILYNNAAALILSITARIAKQKNNNKKQQQQRLRCLFF